MFKVDIRNYQAIKKVCLEIDKGLTVIVGKTNSGKSAVFRALGDAIFNITTSEEKIRIGQKHAAVRIDNEKSQIIWRRKSGGKNNKTAYQIDGGDPFTKVGRMQLEEVADLLNIREVRLTNNIKEKVNFLPQGAPPFLTDKTSGQLFEFLSLSSNDNYIKVLKKINSDSLGIKNEIISKSASLDTVREMNQKKKEFMERNEGYDEVYERTVKINKAVTVINKVGEKVDRYNELDRKNEIKKEKLNKIIKEVEKVDFDKIKKEFEEVEKETGEVREIKKAGTKFEEKKERIEKVRKEFSRISREYDKAKEIEDGVREEVKEAERMEKELGEVRGLLERIKKKKDMYNSVKEKLNKADKSAGDIDMTYVGEGVREIESIRGETGKIKEMIDKIEKIKQKVDNKRVEDKKAEKLLNEAIEEKREYEEEIGTCPLCGNSLIGGDECGSV